MPIHFPAHLPITPVLPDIEAAIRAHQVVIVAGETGSGKSTQIPKLLLRMHGWESPDPSPDPFLIGHTQPRRIAARTLAERISAELNTPLGHTVGYQVRFTQTQSVHTRLKLMTDGILLQSLQRDPLLRRYNAIIIDEAHERTTNIDWLCAHLHRIRRKRPELYVVITSATLQLEQFAAYFQAPTFHIPGRTFPVAIRYCPGIEFPEAIEATLGETRGHILVFMATEKEIHEAVHMATSRWGHRCTILPLYARLGLSAQRAVFTPSATQKIIFATNVAETSLTIPGVTAVIDTGLARISRYQPHNKIMRLPIEPISQAESNQRAGRAGREQPGICIRLESETDWGKRPPFRDPEILRTHMAHLILQQKAMGLGDIRALSWIDPPQPARVNEGIRLLQLLGACEPDGRLTPIGRQMHAMALDPRWSRAVIAGCAAGLGVPVLAIVSALSLPDLREDPHQPWPAAFQVSGSDFLTYWMLWQQVVAHPRTNALRKWATTQGLSPKRINEWRALFEEIAGTLHRLPDLRWDQQKDFTDAQPEPHPLHACLWAGLPDQVGFRHPEGYYLGAYQVHFYIAPGSILKKKPPPAILTAGIWGSQRPLARIGAAIDRAAFESWVAAHPLLKTQYGDPIWDPNQGRARCTASRSFLGLPLTPLTVDYARVDPAGARTCFIESGMVPGNLPCGHPLWRAHLAARKQAEHWAHKVHDWRVICDDTEMAQGYDAVLPAHVSDPIAFEAWLNTCSDPASPPFGFVQDHLEAFAAQHPVPLDTTHYPDRLACGPLSFPLQYTRLDDLNRHTWIQVALPLWALALLEQAPYPGPIPGYRRLCLPLIPEWEAHWQHGSPPDFFQHVPAAVHAKLAPYCIAYQIQTANQVHTVRDIMGFCREHATAIAQAYQQQIQGHVLPPQPSQNWVWGDTVSIGPIQIPTPAGPLPAYPALVPTADGHQVERRYYPHAHAAEQAHYHGIHRLAVITALQTEACNRACKRLPQWDQTAAQATTGAFPAPIKRLLWERILRTPALPLPRQATPFQAWIQTLPRLLLQPDGIRTAWEPLRQLVQQYQIQHRQIPQAAWPPAGQRFWEHTIQAWLEPRFWSQLPEAHFKRLPLYLEALSRQIEKVMRASPGHPVLASQKTFEHFWHLAMQAWNINPHARTATFRGAVEEFRISLFAQDLKTLFPISAKKLENWE